jgi:hypothetical protein
MYCGHLVSDRHRIGDRMQLPLRRAPVQKAAQGRKRGMIAHWLTSTSGPSGAYQQKTVQKLTIVKHEVDFAP